MTSYLCFDWLSLILALSEVKAQDSLVLDG